MEFLLVILYIGVMVYLANYQEATRSPVPVLNGMMNGLVILMSFMGTMMLLQVFSPQNTLPWLTGIFLVVVAITAIVFSAAAVNSPVVRQRLADLLVHRKSKDENAASPYNPNSSVHTAAIVLAMFSLVYYAFLFVIAGGLEGIARALVEVPPTIASMLTDFVVNVVIALLGVGLFIRRDVQQTLMRLSLRFTARDIRAGLLVGTGLFFAIFIFEQAIHVAAPPELLALWNAPAKALFESLKDGFLLKGIVMAVLYGVGEELLYRGALQPVFGLIPAAVFFTVIHLQYLFTPYMLVILVLALSFGYLRQRYSTTTAITAHIIYNFLPFLLAGVLPGVV